MWPKPMSDSGCPRTGVGDGLGDGLADGEAPADALADGAVVAVGEGAGVLDAAGGGEAAGVMTEHAYTFWVDWRNTKPIASTAAATTATVRIVTRFRAQKDGFGRARRRSRRPARAVPDDEWLPPVVPRSEPTAPLLSDRIRRVVLLNLLVFCLVMGWSSP